ncbi:AAA family ATPase [Amycolatopsis sp. lyj-112]|uniref:AAA family ATPase n=1 Tax=Amycolatopsis sp. lyj-112 TaxID=2789288 RepID=UPI0039782664
MTVILVTGMSGTGKSTTLEALALKGFHTVDTDIGDWIADLPLPGGGTEPQWRPDRIDALITEHERSPETLFIAGTVWNQQDFYSRFDHIVLLSAPIDVVLERIAARDTNPFGKAPEERERIIADTAEIEPLLRESATVEIDTRGPLADVVAQLEDLA